MTIEEDYQKCKIHDEYLSDMINDLTQSLSMWIDGYPFDDDHCCKQRTMIDNACLLIGKPRTMEELATMSGFDDELIELAKQQDADQQQQSMRGSESSQKIDTALNLISRWGGIDGDNRQKWLVDQILRTLTGDDYDEWIEEYEDDGEYEWDMGITL